jgi:predicted RecA/RadA family phage recombinase
MKNFVQPGEYGLTVTAPTGGVTAGQLVIIKAIVGVASCSAAAGAQVEISPEGVFDLAKNAPDTFNPGDVAKVAVGSNIVAVAGTLGIGWVTQAALAGSATVRVKLTPSVASPPTLLASEQETHAAPPHGRK